MKRDGSWLKWAFVVATCVAMVAFAGMAFANGQETCPQTFPWVKMDGLSGKTFTFDPAVHYGPGFKVVAVCWKAGTVVKTYTVEAACDEKVTVTSDVQYDLSHASFKLEQCGTCTIVDDPEPPCTEATCGQTLEWLVNCKTQTKTCPTCACIPSDEGKPVCGPDDCDKTLEWIDNCGNKKYIVCPSCPCVPNKDCTNRCGRQSDHCGGFVDCGTCPIPEPKPDCFTCAFPARYMAETGKWWLERLYFPEGGVVKLMLLEGTQERVYDLVYWTGPADGTERKNVLLHRFNGPGNVDITVPPAGLAIPVGAYIEVYGGKSRITVWVQNPATKVEVQHFIRTWEFGESNDG